MSIGAAPGADQNTEVDDFVDIVIMGGGLAGLSLALQVRQRFPDVGITVFERDHHPAPVAAHKIGESTVEIGAHYFSEILGLRDHLQDLQLRKFGFRFFFSEGARDLASVTEIGASRHLSTPSYQIDRGLFENFLGSLAKERGIDFRDGARVIRFEIGQHGVVHEVVWEQADVRRETRSRWLIDASGRAGLIKRKLDLAESNSHPVHAVWFRVRGHIVLDDWVDDADWQSRCFPRARWLSTNHLVGQGYWVWLIPLASGHHSVGIVADPRFHALEAMNTFAKAMGWMKRFQPRLFDELDPRRDDLLDFAYFRRFSYGCKQVFSAERWALTGEAGVFLDPFYSPGSDFIAIGNTLITELIARDIGGEPIGAHAHVFDRMYRTFYESTLALYQDQYGIFGDPEVLPRKILWDYTYYWGVLSQVFFHGRLTDLTLLGRLRLELAHCRRLNIAIQGFLRNWSSISDRRNAPVMHDHASMPWFCELNRSLNDDLEPDQFVDRIRATCAQLAQLADELIAAASAAHPDIDVSQVRQVLSTMPAAPGHGAPGSMPRGSRLLAA